MTVQPEIAQEAVLHGQHQHMIYIVDDDEAVRDSLRALLESCDFEVQDFGSAMEFLARKNATRGDCLLLDLHMPQVDGLSLLEKMRAAGSQLPTVVITGRSDPVLKQRVLQSGAFALFDKPLAEDALLKAIDLAIASNSGRAESDATRV
jgi:two-component system, LuxR family, response regulator FixJ